MENKDFQQLTFSVENGIAFIRLNRVKAMNSLDYHLTSELLQAFEICQNPEIRVVILSGNGKAFSAGGDIKLMTKIESEPDILNDLLEELHKLILFIRNLEKPVIAVINGFAVGAGLGLALACDFRIAGQSSTYSCAFINIGLVPDSGTSFFLTRLLGYAKATELMITGKNFNAVQALEWGLLNRVVGDNEVEVVAKNFAEDLAKKPTETIGKIKMMINRAMIADLSDQLGLEAIFQLQAAKTKNFREGITAFIEKRNAEFNR